MRGSISFPGAGPLISEMHIAIIGAGPAGLRAAEVAAAGGARVVVYDAKASAGRKFLVAGSGGLNLTKDEPPEKFAANYIGGEERWSGLIAEFGPEALRAWAAEIGVRTFVATSRRVYPKEMKGAPLLRAWVRCLRRSGVAFAMHHRWTDVRVTKPGVELEFATPEGSKTVAADAAILALGGGSWPETGSDGAWVASLERVGVGIAPIAPANCGWEVAWPAGLLAEAEGRPLKNIRARANGQEAHGELLITRYGFEGGIIYQLGAALRAMERPEIELDLKPALDESRLAAKLGPARRDFLGEALARWRLDAGAAAVLAHHSERGSWASADAMARAAKHCRIALLRPRPLAEAISSAGGVRWGELDDRLMLGKLPGVFVAGEMIDWEAPTGGYLLQGCFATGTRAARGALQECGKP